MMAVAGNLIGGGAPGCRCGGGCTHCAALRGVAVRGGKNGNRSATDSGEPSTLRAREGMREDVPYSEVHQKKIIQMKIIHAAGDQ